MTEETKPLEKGEISYCIICGARFEEDAGWIDPHTFPCANHQYGWNFTRPFREGDRV